MKRVFGLLLATSVAAAETLSPLVKVPLQARAKAPAGARFYRMDQQKSLFAASPGGWRVLHEQADGAYKVLGHGRESWFADGPQLQFDWFTRPHGAGFVLHTDTATSWEGMVFPKGTLGAPVHWSLSDHLVRSDYDQHGVFCVEAGAKRFRWDGKGFRRK